MSVRIFLSAVSDEFRDYRDRLRADLTRPDVEVKIQENFKDFGTVTLDKLDRYIAGCDAVVHLVGDMTGAAAKDASTSAIVGKCPGLADKLPPLREPLQNRRDIAYTQWEAWLALYHDKLLPIAVPGDDAPRGPRFAPSDASRAAQRAHLERLSEVERYPGCTFTSPDNLAKQILSGAIVDLLAREALSAASIDEIETAVRAKSPKLTAAQIDRFIQSLRDLKGDPSFARAVEEARNGNTRVAEGIWLQIYENRKKERQKAQQEQAEAARNLAASAVTNSVAEGLKWYREATDLDPDNMEGWVGLGDAAVAAGTLKEADAAFLKYIELARRAGNEREVAVGSDRRGSVKTAQGDLAGALKSYRRQPRDCRPAGEIRSRQRRLAARSLGVVRQGRRRAGGAGRPRRGAGVLSRQPRDQRAAGEIRSRQRRLAARSLGVVRQGRRRAGGAGRPRRAR